ncbi:MAG: radical SAM protein [Candidatus Thermoplasmatota archaeon]|nr:radical SAM protein [Candidatus Thermoplasmatota archaeon]
MKVLYEKGHDELAKVYAASFRDDDIHILEFVDSLSGSGSIDEKWVVVVSSQFGCPVGCKMCDTKGYFEGNPTTEELFSQIDHLVKKRFPDGNVTSKKFKVQFARMGEPAFNTSVLEAISQIRERYNAPGYMPCISTVAPSGTEKFFEELKKLNHDIFKGNFQLQFSIHSTDVAQRDEIIPIEKWSLERIAEYGKEFFVGGRRISLNFALGKGNKFDAGKIIDTFSPEVFMLKLTPVNPTEQAKLHDMVREDLVREDITQISELESASFEVVLSVGDLRENEIGSNCGQLAALWRKST